MSCKMFDQLSNLFGPKKLYVTNDGSYLNKYGSNLKLILAFLSPK